MAAGPLNDAQIAGHVLAFNRAEVQTAQAVKGKLSTPPVWQLAQRVSVDDSAIDQQLGALAGPNQSPDSAGVADGQTAAAIFSNLSGDDLEKAYVDREIQTHQTMLNVLDGQLIPSAKSEALQRRLSDVRAETAAQLADAQKVQHTLKVNDLMALPPDPVGTL
jgi:putative membrane protein